MSIPREPKIYHIVHVDRLPSIMADGFLWCDAEITRRASNGTIIGMNNIKQRRLHHLTLSSHPELRVGDCVPFYFCPRSIMLYLIHQANHSELEYRGGQGPIIHLEADLRQTVAWAERFGQRWAFTLSNAGSFYFKDLCNLAQLDQINWLAVQATNWAQPQVKEGKQAEFLIEYKFPWELISRIGVQSQHVYRQVTAAVQLTSQQPRVEIKPDWYY
jgi:ssDNA thymidine ADP-ribosyltransferase, DarT